MTGHADTEFDGNGNQKYIQATRGRRRRAREGNVHGHDARAGTMRGGDARRTTTRGTASHRMCSPPSAISLRVQQSSRRLALQSVDKAANQKVRSKNPHSTFARTRTCKTSSRGNKQRGRSGSDSPSKPSFLENLSKQQEGAAGKRAGTARLTHNCGVTHGARDAQPLC